MSRNRCWIIAGFAVAVGLSACDESQSPLEPDSPSASEQLSTPTPLVPVQFGSWQGEFWIFTANESGTPSDPINLIFPNREAREIRASLMFLNGDRTAFGLPNAPPFNCEWKEAVGDAQLAFSREGGWSGSGIQLECGDYDPMRFHLRLFAAGSSTIANAHFEVIVPGTNLHEVLSWELAEQLVRIDFLRSGLLDSAVPVGTTAVIGPAPTYRTINPLIYNGLPPALRAVIGGPLGDVAASVPMPSDGRATIVNMAASMEGERTIARREFVIPFDQIIPKPFCSAGPFDYLQVAGPITVKQTVMIKPNGDFASSFHAYGTLEVTPVNPLTGAVLGDSYQAVINELHRNLVTDERTRVTMLRLHKLISGADAPFQGMLTVRLEVSSDAPKFTIDLRCNQ